MIYKRMALVASLVTLVSIFGVRTFADMDVNRIVATDSAAEFSLSTSVYPGNDVPQAQKWFSPIPDWHDMWLYRDADPNARNRMWVVDRYLKWPQSAIDGFRADKSFNLVHEIRVSPHTAYEAENYLATDIPGMQVDHNEDSDEAEEQSDGYEEKEAGTLSPETLVANRNYFVRTEWTKLQAVNATFTSESELTKDHIWSDPWWPEAGGYTEIGSMKINTTPIAWDFNSAGIRNGWTSYNLAAWSVNNGIYFLDPNAGDFYTSSPSISVNAEIYQYFKVRMATNAKDNVAKLYFRTQKENFYSEDKTIRFYVNNCSLCGNAGFYTISIDAGLHSKWRGVITGVRLDPAENGTSSTNRDSIGIDYIRLSATR